MNLLLRSPMEGMALPTMEVMAPSAAAGPNAARPNLASDEPNPFTFDPSAPKAATACEAFALTHLLEDAR